MSRRAFGKFLAVSAGAGLAFTQGARATGRTVTSDQQGLAIYAFYPMENGVVTSCNACLNHATNKRFATQEAAEANRAHPGCNCTMLKIPATEQDFVKMFGGSPDTATQVVFDIRHPGIA